MKKYTGKSEFEAGIGGSGSGGAGSISSGRMGRGSDSRADIAKMNQEYKDYMSRLKKERGIKGTNPIEPKIAEPLTKQQIRARDTANAKVQKSLPRMPKKSKSYEEEMPEAELEFKKGGKVSSASKRADGCALRGKTRA